MRRLLLIVMLAGCEVPNPRWDSTKPDEIDAESLGIGDDGGSPGDVLGANRVPLDGSVPTGGSGGSSGQGGMQAVTPPDALPVTDAAGGRPTPDAGAAGVDAAVPGPTSLIAHLALTEQSGTTAFDSSGLGNNGRLHCIGVCSNGTPMRLMRDGRRGVEIAYWQAIDIAPSPSTKSLTDDFSFFTWANRIDQAGVRPLISRLATDGKSYALHFYFDGGRVGATVGTAKVVDTSITPPFSWHHVGVIRRAGVITVFRNAVALASTPSPSVPMADAPFLIGASEVGTYNVSFADSILNNLALYNRALSDSEVMELFRGGLPR